MTRRPPLYPPDIVLPPDVAEDFRAHRGPDARAALTQFRALEQTHETAIALSVGGFLLRFTDDVEAAWAAIDGDSAGNPASVDVAPQWRSHAGIQPDPCAPHFVFAFEVPLWNEIADGVGSTAFAVLRDREGARTFAFWRTSRGIEPRRVDELTAALARRLGADGPLGARPAYRVPIAGTGVVDDTRWSFEVVGEPMSPLALTQLAGVRPPVMAHANFNDSRLRGVR